MAAVAEQQDVFLGHFAQLQQELAGSGRPALDRLRQEAIHRFMELGVPTTRLEDWKYTNVAPVARVRFVPARNGVARLSAERIASLTFGELDGPRLVVVNGRFAASLSTLETLPRGVRAGSLAQALVSGDAAVEGHLARYADHRQQHFVALNTAFLNDGLFVEIPRGLVVEQPIQLLYLTVPGEAPTVSHPRTLLVAGPSSQATLVESYLCVGEGNYFTNAVTEVVLGENAVLDYTRLQRESEQAFHIGTVQTYQERNSSLDTHSLALGGLLVRNDLNAVLDGEGCYATLKGLYVVRGRQHVDNHTRIDHARPHGTSRELYKGILDGHASGVFNGAIVVRKDAQKTDSIQKNRNLLLSADALINTKPQLEIFADDVRCTHGATVGQLDKDALFYLRSRGLAAELARSLMIYAFASEIVDGLKVRPLAEGLHDLLAGRLAKEVGF